MKRFKEIFNNNSGFTLLEVLIAAFILAVALLALSSIATSTVQSNNVSRRYMEAAVLAQSTIESLRYTGFKLGANQIITADMTPAGHPLSNPSTTNDTLTYASVLFASPDHAYTYSNGAEQLPILDNPSLAISTNLRRAWVIRDNIPSAGMKTITVIVGWQERTMDFYLTVSTAIQGQ